MTSASVSSELEEERIALLSVKVDAFSPANSKNIVKGKEGLESRDFPNYREFRKRVPRPTAEEYRAYSVDAYFSVRSLLRMLQMDVDDLGSSQKVDLERLRTEIDAISSRLTDLYEITNDSFGQLCRD